MRLERLSSNQFKIFLTFDDLSERGLTKEDLWHDLPEMQALFHDMMFEASDELDFELEGILIVQVHLLQAQGMLIIVTQNQLDDEKEDDFVEMKVTLDESKELIFLFDDFEDIIQLSLYLKPLGVLGGDLYHFENNYYLHFLDEDIETFDREHFIAVLSEFSSASVLTIERLQEYGKLLIHNNAIEALQNYFPTN